MFISDWKSIRCEEVQKNTGSRIFRSLNSKTSLPPQKKKSDRTPPAYSVKWGWGNVSSRDVRFYLWMEFLGALSEDQLLPISLLLWIHQKRLIALALEDLIITLFYVTQFIA